MAILRRLTVFGGSGFIGRYIVQRLAARGAVVAVVGRHARRASYLTAMGDVGQIGLLNADLGDERAVTAAIEGADTVVNLVGILAETGDQQFEPLHRQATGRAPRFSPGPAGTGPLHTAGLAADP